VNKCAYDEWYTGASCSKNYENTCGETGFNLFYKQMSGSSFKDDSCQEKKCTDVNMYVSDYNDEGNTDVNPFMPKGLQCCHNGQCSNWFGKEEGLLKEIGKDNACIYKVEAQGTYDKIEGIGYSWFVDQEYKLTTFGNF